MTLDSYIIEHLKQQEEERKRQEEEGRRIHLPVPEYVPLPKENDVLDSDEEGPIYIPLHDEDSTYNV